MALGKEFRYVKPRRDLLVRFPRSYTALPERGGVVPWVGADGRYWRRRARVGDVEITIQIKEKVDGQIKEKVVDEVLKSKFRKLSGEKEEK